MPTSRVGRSGRGDRDRRRELFDRLLAVVVVDLDLGVLAGYDDDRDGGSRRVRVPILWREGVLARCEVELETPVVARRDTGDQVAVAVEDGQLRLVWRVARLRGRGGIGRTRANQNRTTHAGWKRR